MTRTILIVDDNPGSVRAIGQALERAGYQVLTATTGAEAIDIISREEINVVIADLKLPDVDDTAILVAAKQKDPAIIVIVITGYGTVESAVEAMKKGAYYYLRKPINIHELQVHIEKALEKQELIYKIEDLSRRLDEKYGFDGLIGVSEGMNKVFEQVRQVAPTKSIVLIRGESGTGKELIARAIHHNSPRKNYPFLAINCSALSESLLESELFGHEKGAFTGAISAHKGYFEMVDKGTIFLDEIGDMSLITQAKLLRVLETREFIRVGGTTPVKTDIRIIAATNKDLEKAVAEKRFREDLYYRLKVFCIFLPSLRERKEDIPFFVKHFLSEFAKENNKEPKHLSKEAMELLLAYDWPGNVRELRNCLERITITTTDKVIVARDLVHQLKEFVPSQEADSSQRKEITIPLGSSIETIEKEVIRETLAFTGGNRTRTAEILKIGLRTLQRKMKRYNLN